MNAAFSPWGGADNRKFFQGLNDYDNFSGENLSRVGGRLGRYWFEPSLPFRGGDTDTRIFSYELSDYDILSSVGLENISRVGG